MNYLADSDYVIDYLNGRKQAVELLRSVHADLSISIITYGEVLEGILYEKSSQQRLEALHWFLEGTTVIPVDRAIAEMWPQISASLRTARTPLPDADLLIAATAIVAGATLLTRNRRHFERVPNLTLIDHE